MDADTPKGWADPPGVGQTPLDADPSKVRQTPGCRPPCGWADPPRCRSPQGLASPPGCRPLLGLGQTPLGCRPPPPDADQPGLGRPLPLYGQQVGGTRPTGMHTCSKRFVSKSQCLHVLHVYCPQNSSCRKVMFSQACVSHSVHGGRVSLVSGSFLVPGPMSFLG